MEIKTYDELIEKEKIQSEKSNLDNLILQYYKDMMDNYFKQNYVNLVRNMVKAQQQIDDLEQRQLTEYNNQIATLKSHLKQQLENVYNDPSAMPQFAYELRKKDFDVYNSNDEEFQNLQPDYFTKKFLDLGVITSPIWQAIIKSNYYV